MVARQWLTMMTMVALLVTVAIASATTERRK